MITSRVAASVAFVLTGVAVGILLPARAATPANWSTAYQPTRLEWLALRLQADFGASTASERVFVGFRASPRDSTLSITCTADAHTPISAHIKAADRALLRVKSRGCEMGGGELPIEISFDNFIPLPERTGLMKEYTCVFPACTGRWLGFEGLCHEKSAP
jgi:hypothetical protein